jgi:endonuclease/exonuclease/phosphatase family metal-dependent hydrolase
MKSYSLKLPNFPALLLILAIFLWAPACKTGTTDDSGNNNNINPTPTPIQITSEGSANTLEIATWNLEHFPINGNTTIEKLATIIDQLDIDIYAVQEIEDTSSFDNLIDNLDGYTGIYSDHNYGDGSYQKTGIIYKQDMITLLSSQLLFIADGYAFPRPPLMLYLQTEKEGKIFDFYLIVIHLKAFSEPENVERRRAASLALKTYIDNKIADPNETEKDYIIAGDWNDEITDPVDENAFQIFIDAPNAYRFLTDVLADDPVNASFPSWGSLIDHILISEDCFNEYNGGTIKTIRLDDQYSEYSVYISDHRPVMAAFPVF